MTKIAMIINGNRVGVQTKTDLINCLQILLQSLDKYSPKDVFVDNMKTALDTIYELSELLGSEHPTNKKLVKEIIVLKRKLSLLKNSFPFIKTKEAAISLQYNIMLAFDGLGILNGFGATNKWGDKIENFNPERQSIV
jgi:hypothetical protein